MKYDAVALGELLIDFTGEGLSPRENPVFEANPGGAPGNVLAMLAKLGKKTAFIGKVGDDMFGAQILHALARCGIDTRGVSRDSAAPTALAFVRNLPGGEREFTFVRSGSADTRLCENETDAELLENCRVFHFGSLSLTHEPARSATEYAVRRAHAAGAVISFDPNLREMLWDNLSDARERMLWGLAMCDVAKVSGDELEFITRESSTDCGIEWLRRRCPQIKLLLVTHGARGATGCWGELTRSRAAFLSEKTVDTTGAGDIFLGCCLSSVLEHGLDSPAADALDEMLAFASAAASLVTQKRGALLCAPDRREIDGLLSVAK